MYGDDVCVSFDASLHLYELEVSLSVHLYVGWTVSLSHFSGNEARVEITLTAAQPSPPRLLPLGLVAAYG